MTVRIYYHTAEYRNEADDDSNQWITAMVLSDACGFHLVISDPSNVLVDMPIMATEPIWSIVSALQQTAVPTAVPEYDLGSAGSGLESPASTASTGAKSRPAWQSQMLIPDSGVA